MLPLPWHRRRQIDDGFYRDSAKSHLNRHREYLLAMAAMAVDKVLDLGAEAREDGLEAFLRAPRVLRRNVQHVRLIGVDFAVYYWTRVSTEARHDGGGCACERDVVPSGRETYRTGGLDVGEVRRMMDRE